MKARESGMPDEGMWKGFFEPDRVLAALGLTPEVSSIVDFGCGYGTFTVPAARQIKGLVHGLDIEPGMIEDTRRKAEAAGLTNLRLHLKDFIADGTGLPGGSAGYVMLFNILHAEDPRRLLREAHRILSPGGRAAVMHWNHDARTPRGPSMGIRPRPEDCHRWMTEEGFKIEKDLVELPPYHYGIIGRKENSI